MTACGTQPSYCRPGRAAAGSGWLDGLAAGPGAARVRRRCTRRVPADARDRSRRNVIPGPAPDDRLVLAPVAPGRRRAGTRFPIAGLPMPGPSEPGMIRRGRHLRFHRHSQVGPLPRLRRPCCAGPAANPVAILRDGPSGLRQSGAVLWSDRAVTGAGRTASDSKLRGRSKLPSGADCDTALRLRATSGIPRRPCR